MIDNSFDNVFLDPFEAKFVSVFLGASSSIFSLLFCPCLHCGCTCAFNQYTSFNADLLQRSFEI